MISLTGRRAIVTGASAGLGAAIAAELLARGARVVISSRSPERLRAAAERMHADAARQGGQHAPALFTIPADVRDPETAPRLAASAREHLGGLDILVCNAGGPLPGDFGDMDDAAWQEGFGLVLLAPIRLIRACLPLLRESGSGRIVLMNSMSALHPVKRLILSNTLRPGLVGLARHLGGEFAKDGILVNVIAPGYFATDRAQEVQESIARMTGRTADEVRRETEVGIALKRQGDPPEVGRLVAFLASTENTYITGQTIVIDGGLTTAP